jgi:SAM-dependent methyltransferase
MFISLMRYDASMNPTSETAYVGGELNLFSLATNWKCYVKAAIKEYLVGDVLEVGAGIGSTTAAMHSGIANRWICLEPDLSNASRLKRSIVESSEYKGTQVIAGALDALAKRSSFDCILYMDVLEHIDDDRDQIQAAAQLVRPEGYIIILSPAHQWLFSEFDKSIGHLRRYNKELLQSLMPSGWIQVRLAYLDSVGALLSLANALALRQAMPSPRQIAIWDRFCIPLSRIMDFILREKCGKSILAVWRKPNLCNLQIPQS